jgi:RNA polymerase sigma factor (sigma-70 family)
MFRARRDERSVDGSSKDEVAAVIQRLEVGRLLALLTERQRAIVVAHYYLGLTQNEIADALGVKRGTVSATVSQSLAHMRNEVTRG